MTAAGCQARNARSFRMEDRRADADEAGADDENFKTMGEGERDEIAAQVDSMATGRENGMGQRSVTMPTTGCNSDAVT